MIAKSGQDLTGRAIAFEKHVTAAEVDCFAAISGDDHPIHLDESAARRAGLSGRIAQGSMLVGLMAGASTKFFRELDMPALSYGYDKIRFTGQVDLGETLRVTYKIVRHDRADGKTWAEMQVADRDGRVVAVGTHVAKILCESL